MWNVLLYAGVAAAAALLGNEVCKSTTGRSIPDHVFGWWCDLRDRVNAWRLDHPNLWVSRYVGYVLERVDFAAASAKSCVTVVVKAETETGSEVTITSRRVPIEELHQQCPAAMCSNKFELAI